MNISGHRWLFSFPASKNSTPLICLRHDVDGILWQPHLTNWNHVSTFDAFGYVHASKKDCKFTSCSPNLNYAFITDCSSHVYIYESDRTNLHKHKQYIVRLEDCNRIMGCHATNKYLHILSEKTLYIIDLPWFCLFMLLADAVFFLFWPFCSFVSSEWSCDSIISFLFGLSYNPFWGSLRGKSFIENLIHIFRKFCCFPHGAWFWRNLILFLEILYTFSGSEPLDPFYLPIPCMSAVVCLIYVENVSFVS